MAILPLLVIMIVVFALVWSRRHGKRSPSLPPAQRHVATRIVCGALALGLVAAVGVCTWIDVDRFYARAEPDVAPVMKRPARPAPTLEIDQARRRVVLPDEGAGILCTLLLVEDFGGEYRPLAVRQQVTRWKPHTFSSEQFNAEFKFPGIKLTADLTPFRIRVDNDGTGAKVEWSYTFSRRRIEGTFGSSGLWSTGGTVAAPLGGAACVGDATVGYPKFPLSARGNEVPRVVRLFVLPQPLAADDPLQEVAAAQVVDDRAAELRAAAKENANPSHGYGTVQGLGRGGMLAFHIGLATLALLLAAGLAAQVVRWRFPAFALAMLLMVLYVVALDRAILAANLHRALDEKAPVAERVVACRQTRDTFFYRKTAARALAGILQKGDAEAEPVRQTADRAVQTLLQNPPWVHGNQYD